MIPIEFPGEPVPDEPLEDEVQPAATVARRTLALAACCCRGNIESGKGNADAESVRGRMIQWVTRFNLTEQLGPSEWAQISAPLGSLPPGVANGMTWEAEGLAVLLWALGLGEMPAHDDQVDPYAVAGAAHFLAEDVDEFIDGAILRPAEELLAFREVMYAIHCRVTGFLRGGGKKDFAGWLERDWLETLKIKPARLLAGGDLAFKGQAIGALGIDHLKRYEQGINEQHRASIWLIGEEANHWETVADT